MLVCKLLTSSTGVSKSNEHHRHDVSYQPMDIQQIPSPKRCRWRRRDAVQAVLRCGLSQDGSCMINKNPTPSTLRIITWDPLLLVVVYHPQLCRKKWWTFALPTEVCGKAFSDSSSMAIADPLREGGYATWLGWAMEIGGGGPPAKCARVYINSHYFHREWSSTQ